MAVQTMFDSKQNGIASKSAEDYRRASTRAIAAQRPEDAVRALRLALELDPLFDAAWNDLGVLMEALGNPREAQRCYEHALAVNPESVEACENLAMLIVQMQMQRLMRTQPVTSIAW